MDQADPIAHATRPQAEDATVHYVIDPQGSTFITQAFATGLLSSFGHSPKLAIRDFKGELSFSQNGMSIEGARLNISIQADSLEVTDDIAEKDRQEIHRKMCEEVLETDRFPEIVYQCSRVSASGSGARYWVVIERGVDITWSHSTCAGFGAGGDQWKFVARERRVFGPAESIWHCAC